MLHQAISGVEEALDSVTEEIRHETLNRYRRAAVACLKQIGRIPGFTDDSFTDYEAFPADAIYRTLLQGSTRDAWEKRALRKALLYLLLLGGVEEEDLKALLVAIATPPILTAIAIPPDSTVMQLALVKEYFVLAAHLDSSNARLASLLDGLLRKLLESTPSPELFGISPENRDAIEASIKNASPTGRIDTSSDRLRKLAISINTRVGQSLRHLHIPIVQQVPDSLEVTNLLQAARLYRQELGDWLSMNALLSSFAITLFGEAGKPRIALTGDRGNAMFCITAPDLERRGLIPSGAAWESVGQELYLPIPRRVLERAEQIRKSPGFDVCKMKQQMGSFISTWSDEQGLRIKRGVLHRLLPYEFGCVGGSDSTLMHLLGLAEISRRDAGIHYFSPSIPEVVRRYRQAVEAVATQIDQTEWLADGWTEVPEQVECFGASMRPSRDAAGCLVEYLKAAAQLSRGKPSAEARLRSFNAEAAYLTVLFLASTGARPVEDVFPLRSQWNPESGELLLSEKDSLLYRSTRKLPMVERLKAGVTRHVERQRALEVQMGRRFDSRLVVFLVSEEGEAMPPTIANMKRLIPGFADHWPWPNDILRHHFRSRIWELGCGAYVLDRAMGHLSKSQTPDAAFAMQPISDSVRHAVPFINRLLDEIGF